jgi:DNA-binding protein HU-alpha
MACGGDESLARLIAMMAADKNDNVQERVKPMRKPELAAAIADKADISQDKANQVLSAILDEITNSLSRNEAVALVGFGTFEPRSRAARNGINPKTGEAIQIAASTTVGFKPGKALKDAVN